MKKSFLIFIILLLQINLSEAYASENQPIFYHGYYSVGEYITGRMLGIDGTLWGWDSYRGSEKREELRFPHVILKNVKDFKSYPMASYYLTQTGEIYESTIYETDMDDWPEKRDYEVLNETVIDTDVSTLTRSAFYVKNDGLICRLPNPYSGMEVWPTTEEYFLSIKDFAGCKLKDLDYIIVSDIAYRMFAALDENGNLWMWQMPEDYAKSDTNILNIDTTPQIILSDVNDFYMTSNAIYVLKNDGTFLETTESDLWVQKADSVKSFLNHYDTTFIIKNDDSCWVKGDKESYSFGKKSSSFETEENNGITDEFRYITDNVRSIEVGDILSGQKGVYVVKNDNTLWTWGYPSIIYDIKDENGETVSQPFYTPTKVSVDNVSQFVNGGTNMIIKTDNSLWVCGEGSANGTLIFRPSKPTCINENIYEDKWTYALGYTPYEPVNPVEENEIEYLELPMLYRCFGVVIAFFAVMYTAIIIKGKRNSK